MQNSHYTPNWVAEATRHSLQIYKLKKSPVNSLYTDLPVKYPRFRVAEVLNWFCEQVP